VDLAGDVNAAEVPSSTYFPSFTARHSVVLEKVVASVALLQNLDRRIQMPA
jgi:hypothetical protein